MTQFTPFLKLLILATGLMLASTVHAIDYTYDDLNRLVQVTYSNGQTIHYTYDAVGNLLSVVLIDNQADHSETSHQVADISNTMEKSVAIQ